MPRMAALSIAITTVCIGVSARAEYLYVSLNNNTVVTYDTNEATPSPSTFVSDGLNSPEGLAFDLLGNLYVANGNGTVEKFARDRTATQFASGLGLLYGVAFNPIDSSIFVADEFPGKSVYKFTPNGARTLFASGLANPVGLTFDISGNLYVANFAGNTIQKFTPNGLATQFAHAGLNGPTGLAFDTLGNLYVANENGHNIDKITPGGILSQFARGLNGPTGLAFDSVGNLYVAVGTEIDRITPGGALSRFATTPAAARFLAFGPAPSPLSTPEPSSFAMLGLGLVGLGAWARMKARRRR